MGERGEIQNQSFIYLRLLMNISKEVKGMSYSYQKLKIGAYRLIDKLHAQKKSRDEILIAVQSNFGFGKKIVDERLEAIKGDKNGKNNKTNNN